MNTLFFIIVLGLVQGFTEFLPISSSGHLAFLENLEYFKEHSAEVSENISLLGLNVLLHIGTILAVLLFWQKDILELAKSFFSNIRSKKWKGDGFKTVSLVFYSLIPVMIVPFIKHYVENATANMKIISILFIVNGTLLIVADRIYKRRGHKHNDISHMDKKSALYIGIFQTLAVFPGISRSGSTITAGLLFGLNGRDSVKYSFLISIPVLIAAAFLEGCEIHTTVGLFNSIPWEWLISGIIASFSAGIISMKFLVWLGKKTIFYPFGIYTILLGCLIALI